MQWLRSVVHEVVGLFVDDGSFAAAILIWLAVMLAIGRAASESRWLGCVLFGGLAVVLIESVVRFARRSRG